jgi:outer membrane protein OmpA-like peptidoglycan-associated protein
MIRASSRNALALAAAVAIALAAAGCKTAKPVSAPVITPAVEAPTTTKPDLPLDGGKTEPVPAPRAAPSRLPEPSAISPDAAGFWPSPESRSPAISLSVLVGDEDLLLSWKVEIAPIAAKAAVAAFSGSAADRPEKLSWDGLGPDGKPCREGLYVATLSAEFGSGLPGLSLRSKTFALSLSAPEPALFASPSRLEPGPQGLKKPASFELAASSAYAPLESWRLDIVAPDGRLFRSFEGEWPASGSPSPIVWDGSSGDGASVEAGSRYAAILSVRDAYGHTGSTQAGIAVADLPYASERSSVRPWTNGFSPNGDKVMDSMDFSLGFGQRSAIRAWRLEIGQADKASARVFRGSAPDLPGELSWDGRDGSGAPAPEGRYVATLFVDYGSTFSPAAARSPAFVLDSTPPPLRLSYSPALFSPDPRPEAAQEADSKLSIRLETPPEAAPSLARISDWSVEILDPGDHVFARFAGAWPPKPILWDGIGADGSLVESAESYRLVATSRDEFGNSSRAEGKVDTDILVVKDGERYRVAVMSILFKGYTDDYEDLPPEQVAQNRLTLDRLAAKFAKFPDYRIRLVGHAVMINWDDPNLGKPEQEKILIPLSRTRAAAIAKALASRGIAASRMIVEGVGATEPLVPDSDLVNRWKNRRVEFYLEK